jgi:hypothetical protein
MSGIGRRVTPFSPPQIRACELPSTRLPAPWHVLWTSSRLDCSPSAPPIPFLTLGLGLVGGELLASPRLPRWAYDLVAVRPGRCGGVSRGIRHEGHGDQVGGRRCKRLTRMPVIQRLRESKRDCRKARLGSATRLLPPADRRGSKVDPRRVQESESHPDETVKARLMARCPAQQFGDL